MWIFLDGLLIRFEAFVQICAIRPIKTPAEIGIIRVWVHRALCNRCAAFARIQRHANLAGNSGSDVVLDAQDVVQVAIIGIGPEVCLVADLNELDVDAHTVAVTEDASFQGVLDFESVANLSDGLPGKRGRRSRRNHAEVLWVEVAEPSNHFVGQTGTEVVLLGVAAEIREGNDHETNFSL